MLKNLLLASVFTLPLPLSAYASQITGNKPVFASISLTSTGSTGDASAFTATSGGATVSLGAMLGIVKNFQVSGLTSASDLTANPITVGGTSVLLGNEITILANGLSSVQSSNFTSATPLTSNPVTINGTSYALGNELGVMLTGVNNNTSAISSLQGSALTSTSNLTNSNITVNSSTVTLGNEIATLASGLSAVQSSNFTSSTPLTSNPVTINGTSYALGTELGTMLTGVNNNTSAISSLQGSALTSTSNLSSNSITVNSSNVALGTEVNSIVSTLTSHTSSITTLQNNSLTSASNLSSNNVTVNSSSISLGSELNTLSSGVSNALTTSSPLTGNPITINSTNYTLGTELGTILTGMNNNTSAISNLQSSELTSSSNLTSSAVTVKSSNTTIGSALNTLSDGLAAVNSSNFTSSTPLTNNPVTVNSTSVALGAELSALANASQATSQPMTQRAPLYSDDGVLGYHAPGSVYYIALGNAGSSCSGATVSLSAPPAGGIQATATLMQNSSNAATGFLITNRGSLYATAPTVTVNGCSATGTASLSTVNDIWNSPQGLFQADRVSTGQGSWEPYTGSQGLPLDVVGAPATAVLTGGSPTGYAAGNTVTFPGGLIITVTAVSSGAPSSYTITSPGSYQQKPTTALSQIATSGSGSGWTVLPTAMAYAYSTKLLTRMYTANKALDITCNGVTTTIGFIGTGIDQSAETRACGPSSGLVTRWYNQYDPSDNTDASASTTNAPTLDARSTVGTAQSIFFGQNTYVGSNNINNNNYLVLPSAVTLNPQLNSVFIVGRLQSVALYGAMLQGTNPAQGGANYIFGFGFNGHLGSWENFSATASTVTGSDTSNVMGLISTPTASVLMSDNQDETVASSLPAASLVGGYIGSSPNNFTYGLPTEMAAIIDYAGDMTTSRRTLQANLDSYYGLVPQSNIHKVLELGDSITAGSFTSHGFNWVRQMEKIIPTPISNINAAYPGEGLSNIISNFPTFQAPVCMQGGVEATINFAGTNDIGGGSTDTQTENNLASLLQAETAAGCGRLYVITMLARADFTTQQQTYRTNYNAWIMNASNQSTYGFTPIDVANDPSLSTVTSTYYADGTTHPNTLADGFIAQDVAKVIAPYLH